MGKFDDKVDFYKAQMDKLGLKCSKPKLIACAKACGPSLYRADAETVSASDKEELGRVKKNYLMKKLGCTERTDLDGVINYAIDKIGKSNRSKYRAIFYYLCSEKVRKWPS